MICILHFKLTTLLLKTIWILLKINLLACSHILKFGSMINIQLFGKNSCLNRWKRVYFESRPPFFSSLTAQVRDPLTETDVFVEIANNPQKSRRPLFEFSNFHQFFPSPTIKPKISPIYPTTVKTNTINGFWRLE